MSANRIRVAARLSFLAVTTAIVGVSVFSAGPARAQTASSPGQQIAAALRSSPLYVDPSLSSAFTPAVRTRLLQEIRKAPVPVYILAVPLVSGGQWSSGEQLATVVQNYFGRPGVYLTTDANFGNDIDAFTWPSDPQGTDAPPYHAADAAQAENLSPNGYGTTLPDKFGGCIQLITTGKAVAAYTAAVSKLDTTPAASPARRAASGGGLSAVVIAAIAVVVVLAAGLGALLLTRRRRRPSPFVRPRSVFAAARTATEAQLRDQAQQQVIALGELVEQPGPVPDPAPPGRAQAQSGPAPADAAPADAARTDAAQALTGRALDAYEAAGKVLDHAAGVCDLAGVLVLTHLGFNAAEAARAVQSGKAVPACEPLCFFNPLHGEAAREIHWRPLGSRQTLDVHVCAECAGVTAQHRLPDVLVDQSAGQSVPYYEVSGDRSVWAATGYGQFGNDLVQRILTSDIHPTH